MKNKKIINIVESFDSTLEVNTNLTGIKKVNQNMIPKFLDGNWTSSTSDFLYGKTPTNTIRFSMKSLNSGVMYYKNVKYPLESVDYNGLIKFKPVNGNQYMFTPNFNNANLFRLPNKLPDNIPTLKMMSSGNDITETTVIFKFMKGKLDPTAMEMVKHDQVHPNTDGIFYNKPQVLKIESLYKFRYDAVVGEYTELDSFDDDMKKKIAQIKEKYNNIVSFQLLRYFVFSNYFQGVFTRYSQLYNIKFIKGNKVLTSLKLRRLKEELSENKLTNYFNIWSWIFLHKVTKFNTTYDYKEPNIVFEKNKLLLQNGAENYFEDYIYAPNLPSARKTLTSKFDPKIIYSYNNYDKNDIPKSINTENKNVAYNILNLL